MSTFEKADRGRIRHTNPRAMQLSVDVVEAVKALRKAILRADALDDARRRARGQRPCVGREVQRRWERSRVLLAKARAELDEVLLGDGADAEEAEEPAESLEEYESALHWIRTELQMARDNTSYAKGTLITNLQDRVDAVLQEGHYRPRE